MKVFVEIAAAVEQLEELIDLVSRENQVVICRAGDPIAALEPVAQKGQGTMDDLWAPMAEGRPATNGQTSNPDEFYDGNGLPK